MAQARQVKVGQIWTARISKKEVQVQVLAERTGTTGRKQFQIKNLDSNRTSSKWWSAAKLKTLVSAGAAANPAPIAPPAPARAPAQPAPAARKPKKRRASKKSRPSPAQRAAEDAGAVPDFFGGDPYGDPEPSRLESLRGRPRPSRAPARRPRRQARERAPAPPPPELHGPPVPSYPSPLAEAICEAIKQTDGSEYEIRDAYSRTLASYRFQRPPAMRPPYQGSYGNPHRRGRPFFGGF